MWCTSACPLPPALPPAPPGLSHSRALWVWVCRGFCLHHTIPVPGLFHHPVSKAAPRAPPQLAGGGGKGRPGCTGDAECHHQPPGGARACCYCCCPVCPHLDSRPERKLLLLLLSACLPACLLCRVHQVKHWMWPLWTERWAAFRTCLHLPPVPLTSLSGHPLDPMPQAIPLLYGVLSCSSPSPHPSRPLYAGCIPPAPPL